MRFAHLYVRTAVLASALLVLCSCQTAQKPVSLMPGGSAPVLTPAPANSRQSAVAQKKDRARTPSQSSSSPTQTQGQQAPQSAAQSGPASKDQKPAAPEPAASIAPLPDPVAGLVDRAEKEYQSGLDNYRSGKQDDARQNFDSALNALLGSSYDVRSDTRLEKEFDRIVEGVNELYPGGTSAESETAEQAQEPQQKSEPAPIDETNGITPSADASTKAKAEAEIRNTHSDLPLMMTDQVAGFIAYFSSNRGRGVFERAIARSGRYREMMLPILKQEG